MGVIDFYRFQAATDRRLRSNAWVKVEGGTIPFYSPRIKSDRNNFSMWSYEIILYKNFIRSHFAIYYAGFISFKLVALMVCSNIALRKDFKESMRYEAGSYCNIVLNSNKEIETPTDCCSRSRRSDSCSHRSMLCTCSRASTIAGRASRERGRYRSGTAACCRTDNSSESANGRPCPRTGEWRV